MHQHRLNNKCSSLAVGDKGNNSYNPNMYHISPCLKLPNGSHFYMFLNYA